MPWIGKCQIPLSLCACQKNCSNFKVRTRNGSKVKVSESIFRHNWKVSECTFGMIGKLKNRKISNLLKVRCSANMVAQGHGKFAPIVVADPRESFRVKKKWFLPSGSRKRVHAHQIVECFFQRIFSPT